MKRRLSTRNIAIRALVSGWAPAAALLAVVATSALAQDPGDDFEAALAHFATAGSPRQAAEAAAAVRDSGVDFETLYGRLRAGARAPGAPPTGRLLLEHRTADDTAHPFLVLIPDSYDPDRSYPVRVYLHGGVNRPAQPADGGWWREPARLASDGYIAVFPYSWSESLWWQARQVESIDGILWRLRRSYNVDENRISLFGVSDGGTGAWFFAFRDTTPWAAFLPFIAHPAVLSNPGNGAAGELYPINLANKPFYVVNGGQDRLYPAEAVAPYMTLFRDAGAELTFVTKPEAGHSTAWWPQEAAAIDAFLAAHPRDPLPDHLVWRTDSVGRYGRAHWLVIDEIADAPGEPAEPNAVMIGGRRYLAFPRGAPSGQVELQRRGNEVDATAHGVRRFTLLISPAEFDFSEPVVVRCNGVEVFRGLLETDREVLLKWAARDRDRTMLFGAELEIDVDR